MGTEVMAAMIALCGVLISAFVSFLVGFWGKRHNSNQLFAEIVSENRLEWMNSIRTNLSKFLANAETLREMKKSQSCSFLPDGKCVCEQYITLKRDMLEARELVATRLNLDKGLQNLMYAALKNLDMESDNFYQQRDYIEDLARKMLRSEWDSVKNEAKGKEE